MKLKMNYGTVKTVIFWAVAVLALGVCAADIAMLVIYSGKGSQGTMIPLSVSLAGCALLIAQCLVMLLLSGYKFCESELRIRMGFFLDRIAYADVIVLRQNSKTDELYLVFNGKKATDGRQCVRINLKGSRTEAFIDELRRHVDELAIELFSEQKGKD